MISELRWQMRGVAFTPWAHSCHLESNTGTIPEPLEFQTAMVSDEDHELQWQAMHYAPFS